MNYRILLSLSLLLMACSKKKDTSTPTENTPFTNKKGVDFNTQTTNGTWYDNVVNLKSHWFYTWGTVNLIHLSSCNKKYGLSLMPGDSLFLDLERANALLS